MRIAPTTCLILLSAAAGLRPVGATVPHASPQVPSLNACELLSLEDVARLIGESSSDMKRDDDGLTADGAYSSTCVWRFVSSAASEDRPVQRLLILNAMRWPNAKASGHFLESFREASRDHTIEHGIVPLKNLGDEALWWGDGVAVRRGAISFGVSTMNVVAQPDQRQNVAEKVARQVLSRLKGAPT